MIRKLWLERDLFWIFLILSVFMVVITVEYTMIAERSWIMVYEDSLSFGLQASPTPPKPEEIEAFLKEHPQGQIISLKDRPLSYFDGFDGMARLFLPYVAVMLCVGGILCEKSSGTASFVVSLPVPRASWIWSRAAVLLLLTFVTALLACIATYLLAVRLGIHQSPIWIVTEPIRLTLVASPGIGLSLYLQSLLAARFDQYNVAPIAVVIMLLLIFVTNSILDLASSNAFTPGGSFIDVVGFNTSTVSWAFVGIANTIGVASLFLAVRRFERTDF
jgi:ABC-type transport system involved in multi-copper enzyme maturation permease subunit